MAPICCECGLKITDNNKKILNCDHEIHNDCINIALSKSKVCPFENCNKSMKCPTCSELLIKDHTCKYVCKQCKRILDENKPSHLYASKFFNISWALFSHGFHDKNSSNYYTINCNNICKCIYDTIIATLLWIIALLIGIIEIIFYSLYFIIYWIVYGIFYGLYYLCIGITKCPSTCYESCYILRNNYRTIDNSNNV